MNTDRDFLADLWRDLAGLPPALPPRAVPALEVLRATEWSPRFERLMRNRLILGAIRYGRLHAPNKLQYDRLAAMIKRIALYRDTGNDELLVDVANLALLEFEEGRHPEKHFGTIDDGEHVATV